MNKHHYKAWLIDLDGTLYDARPVKLLMAIELIFAGPRVWRLISQFRKAHEELRACPDADAAEDSTRSSFERQLALAAERAGADIDLARRTITKWMFERPGKWLWLFRRRSLFDEIRRHRQAGGTTALVSDYPAKMKLLALHADSLFDCVVANGETEPPVSLKPAPHGFLRAAEDLNLPPCDCLVIGDRLDADGKAAESADMAFQHVS
jgi:FMN phosphatase YigB (HAD superfamily)